MSGLGLIPLQTLVNERGNADIAPFLRQRLAYFEAFVWAALWLDVYVQHGELAYGLKIDQR